MAFKNRGGVAAFFQNSPGWLAYVRRSRRMKDVVAAAVYASAQVRSVCRIRFIQLKPFDPVFPLLFSTFFN
jgi:hypothetical protein